jgi:hypothetical protein
MKSNTAKIESVKRILKDFTQSSDLGPDELGYRYHLSGDYDLLRIIRFIFAEVLKFSVDDKPMEKINWTIPFVYKGDHHCYVAHEKFGFRVYVPHKSDADAEAIGREIEERLHRALLASGPIIETYADDALEKGEIIVENTFKELHQRYVFFRRKAQQKQRITADSISDERSSRSRYRVFLERGHYEQATYFSFFSLLEHICVLFLGFRDVEERSDVGALSRAKWSDKFKTVFDIADPEFKSFYDMFLGLAKYRRNPAAHGNTNTVFDFYLSGARHKLSVLIMDNRLSMQWHDQSINFDVLDSFLKLLKTHASTKTIFAYIPSPASPTRMR